MGVAISWVIKGTVLMRRCLIVKRTENVAVRMFLILKYLRRLCVREQ